MTEGEMEIPDMFIESYWVEGEENHAGGAVFVKLTDTGDGVLLGEFGMTEEASFITRDDDDWIFRAATDENPDIEKPPFRRVFEADKEELREELQTERFFYGEAIREAWENWSEGDEFYLRIDGDEREFEAEDKRLMQYERGY